ncbi:MAG: class II aldolase/adducin family protein, partial [bacterium]|nr:class II aldolase/adducin family protein [bacterium]
VGVPEAVVSIGGVIPVAPYSFPGAPEQAGIIAETLARCDVFMMAGNGVLSVGRDVEEAYLRMELLEHLLKVDYYAQSMGTLMTIPSEDKQKLLDKRASIGLGPQKVNLPSPSPSPSESNPEAPTPPQPEEPQTQKDLIKNLIAEELKKVLQENP